MTVMTGVRENPVVYQGGNLVVLQDHARVGVARVSIPSRLTSILTRLTVDIAAVVG